MWQTSVPTTPNDYPEVDSTFPLPLFLVGRSTGCSTFCAQGCSTALLGSQGAVLAGGRYDGLVETMGGPATPGVGWAAGIERLAMLIGDVVAEGNTIAVVPVGAEMEPAAFALTQKLRDAGFRTDMAFRGNMSKRLKRADRLHAACAILLGEEEAGRNSVTVRDLNSGEQQEISRENLPAHLERYR